MTYCIGWKTTSAAFLVADSAVTSKAPPLFEKSSFGELHARDVRRGPLDPKMNVEEALLKVFRIGPAIVTACGPFDSAVEVLRRLRHELETTESICDALGRATAAHPQEGGRVQLLLAFFAEGEPRLVSFNKDWDQAVCEEDSIVQLGSASEGYRIRTEEAIREYAEPAAYPTVVSQHFDQSVFVTSAVPQFLSSRAFLALVIAQAQSYGVHEIVLEDRFGGAFSGAYVDRAGVHWQPDILYAFHDRDDSADHEEAVPAFRTTDFVASFVREENLLLMTTENRGTEAVVLAHGAEVFLNAARTSADFWTIRVCVGPFGPHEHLFEHLKANGFCADVWEPFGQQLIADARSRFDAGQFDFVVLLSTANADVTVVEMSGRLHHQLLGLHRPAKGFGIGVGLTRDCLNVIRQPCNIAKYAPFVPCFDRPSGNPNWR